MNSSSMENDLINKSEPYEKFYSNFALGIFAIFLFVVIFGLKMPFGEKIWEAESLVTSNVTNQIVFGSLFICSIFLLILKRRELRELIGKEKFFTIFLIWCLVTILWSNYAFVSFKRYIQYLTTVTVFLSVLLHVKDTKRILNVFKIILGGYLLVALLTILTIPGAKDRFGIWRGIAGHKNTLGQTSLLALIFFAAIVNLKQSLKSKTVITFFIMIGLVLLFGSKSSTSIFTGLIIFTLSLTFMLDVIFKPIGIRKTVSFLTLFIFVVLFVLIILAVPGVLESIAGGAGKDLTLTGRVDLWADIWLETEKHLVFGAGFQGFWVITSVKVEQLFEIYPWLPTQAHNGYLDIINEVGIIGIILFSFILINYFTMLAKSKNKQIWKWFIVAALIINFTESAFIRPKVVFGVMFIFSYFALFSDLIKDKQPDSVTE
ncbi:MAG: O-antigen ligase family protein [Bacteroidetes bacterium]|nr:O-antigen ligase family protein [Bacteroidota bacterium]